MVGISVSIVLGALLSIAGIVLTVLLCAWVYRDAKSKYMNGVLWTLLVLLIPSYIGLIIYLVVRMDNNKVVCSKCNKAVNGSNKFCSNCGEELVPVVEVVEDDTFKKSQKKILIGFFSTIGLIVIITISMVASMMIGSIQLIGDAVEWVSELDTVQWNDTLEETLGDLDVLFDEDEIHVSASDEVVVVTDKDGNELLKVDGKNETVDVNLKDFHDLFEKYGIEYDENMSEEEIEQQIKQQVEESLEEMLPDDEK